VKRTAKSSKTGQGTPLLSIMVPVYNEEKTLLAVLKEVTSLSISSYQVLVVDDASKDKSPEIIEKFKKNFTSKNVELAVFTHPKNRGKGAGIKTALQHAKGKYFVIHDADLEYNATEIPSLLNHATQDDLDVVYGSRFLGSPRNMPKPNYYANRSYNFILRRLYPTKITDMHTCYKMVRTSLLKSLKITSDGFDYAPELVSKILRRGIEINEVPISFNGRNKSQGKKINYKDGFQCIYILISYRVNKKAKA
jgi:glycosyltransferase involved in cell wall biosynthesis